MAKPSFKEMILYIHDKGCSCSDIAKACGVSRGCIDGIRNGVTKEPVHSVGEKIIRFYKAHKRVEQSVAALH